MAEHRVVVIGAGMGGLVSALQLAQQGLSVTVVDKSDQVGGKMRQVLANGVGVESGPRCSPCVGCSIKSWRPSAPGLKTS